MTHYFPTESDILSTDEVNSTWNVSKLLPYMDTFHRVLHEEISCREERERAKSRDKQVISLDSVAVKELTKLVHATEISDKSPSISQHDQQSLCRQRRGLVNIATSPGAGWRRL